MGASESKKGITKGVICTLLGAISWGFSGTCVQYLFSSYQMGSLLLTTIRQLGAGIVFCAFLLIRDRDTLGAMLSDRETVRRLAIFGTFGLFLNSVLYAATISFTNAGTATVLQSLCIVLALLVTCVRTPRIPRPLEICALVSALAAIFLIATHADPSSLKLPLAGLVLGLLCACAATFYTMYPRPLFEHWGSLAVTGLGMFQGGITGLIACTATGAFADAPVLDANAVLVLAITVLIGTCGAYGLFLHGVSIVGPVAGNMLGAAEPVSATVISALWLATPFTVSDWLGLALMVATIFFIALQTREDGAR